MKMQILGRFVEKLLFTYLTLIVSVLRNRSVRERKKSFGMELVVDSAQFPLHYNTSSRPGRTRVHLICNIYCNIRRVHLIS